MHLGKLKGRWNQEGPQQQPSVWIIKVNYAGINS